MVATLYLVRHARAEAAAGADDARRLTPAGREEARTLGRALADLGLSRPEICTSPALRCRETADALADALDPSRRPELRAELALDAPRGPLLDLASRVRGATVLVGHQPELLALARALTAGSCSLDLPTAGTIGLRPGDAGGPWQLVLVGRGDALRRLAPA